MKFKKASFKEIVKHKVKWILFKIIRIFKVIWKCVNFPFDKLEKMM